MQLSLISMIRNEIDILPAFLGHIDNLFNGGYLIDHLSSDGSESLLREFTASRPTWEYYPLKSPAYTQADISSDFMRRGFKQNTDAVFFLDADEFIANLYRPQLEESVTALDSSQQIGYFCCMPGEYGPAFALDQPAWHGDLAPHKKIIVPRWLYAMHGEQLAVNQGNHSLRLPAGQTVSGPIIAELLHFPIRSREQFVRKILVSYVAQAMKPNKQVAPHIQTYFDLIMKQNLTPDLLNSIAANYGSPDPEPPLGLAQIICPRLKQKQRP
jgi:hypothetical protein